MADKLFEDRRPGCFTYAYLYPSLLQVHSYASRKEILDLCLKMEFMLNGECYEEGMEKSAVPRFPGGAYGCFLSFQPLLVRFFREGFYPVF